MPIYVVKFIQVPSEIMKNTCIQGKSKKIIHTKTFNYIHNAIQMSTQYVTFPILPDCIPQLPPKNVGKSVDKNL